MTDADAAGDTATGPTRRRFLGAAAALRGEAFAVECWPGDEDPTDPDAEQFLGWPYRLPFDEAGGNAGDG